MSSRKRQDTAVFSCRSFHFLSGFVFKGTRNHVESNPFTLSTRLPPGTIQEVSVELRDAAIGGDLALLPGMWSSFSSSAINDWSRFLSMEIASR